MEIFLYAYGIIGRGVCLGTIPSASCDFVIDRIDNTPIIKPTV